MKLQAAWQRRGVILTRGAAGSGVLMFAALLTAGLAYPHNAGGANSHDWEKVDQDQVLELPSVSQPQSTATDSLATPDPAAIEPSTTPPDCTANPDDGSASAGANGARGRLRGSLPRLMNLKTWKP